jgi:TRAP-type transport system periplasmic protein
MCNQHSDEARTGKCIFILNVCQHQGEISMSVPVCHRIRFLAVVVSLICLSFVFTTSAPALAGTLRLKYANPMPATDKQAWSMTLKPWGDAIKKRTNGQVKLKGFHSGQLIKFSDTPLSMAAGMADMAYFSTMFSPAFFPSWLFAGILDPTTAPRTAFDGIMVSYVLYDEFPCFNKELESKNMFVLLHNSTAPLTLISKKAIPGLDALKGKKVRIFAGEFHAELTKLQGATPIMTPWPEVYESLDKGIVDCMVTVTPAMRDLRLYEVAKYLYTVGGGFLAPMNACYVTGFNLKTFKKLDPATRRILLEEAKRVEREFAETTQTKLYPDALKEMGEKGLEITDWPAGDITRWGKLAAPIYQQAAAKMSKAGLPGDAIVKRYLELTKMPSAELEKLYEKAWDNRFKWAEQ